MHTGLTQFGFLKRYLYPISHNALIMDCFSRAHLYDVPRVTVSSFISEIDREKSTEFSLSANFYGIPIRYSERELWRIYQGHFLEMNFRSLQKPWLPRIISPKYCAPWSKIFIEASSGFHIHLIKISAYKNLYKQS